MFHAQRGTKDLLQRWVHHTADFQGCNDTSCPSLYISSLLHSQTRDVYKRSLSLQTLLLRAEEPILFFEMYFLGLRTACSSLNTSLKLFQLLMYSESLYKTGAEVSLFLLILEILTDGAPGSFSQATHSPVKWGRFSWKVTASIMRGASMLPHHLTPHRTDSERVRLPRTNE